MGKIDDDIKTRFANDHHRLITNIIFTSGWMNNKFANFFKPFDLSSQQFNVLRILRGNGDWMPMTEVKKLMIDKAPNATRLVDKMLEKELLERRRSVSDRRVVFIKLAKKGQDLLTEIDQHNDGEHMDFIKNLSLEEAKIMSDLLDKMRG